MRYVSWARRRTGRLFVILFSLSIYILLLVVDGSRSISHEVSHSSSPFLLWIGFGFSALVALIFLAVGTLIWLYVRNRLIALLLFGFSFTMAMTFAVQTDASSNDPVLSAISLAGSALALSLISTLLLLFPRNYLALPLQPGEESSDPSKATQQYTYILLLRGYVIILSLLSILAALYSIPFYFLPWNPPAWLDTIDNSYYLLALIGILITISISYYQSSLRERQQLRLFVIGVILAFGPFMLLTALPLVLSQPQFQFNAQLSTLTAVLLPLALGYTILRYQILVFDMYIRRAVAWIVGGMSLAVYSYFAVVLRSLLLYNNT